MKNECQPQSSSEHAPSALRFSEDRSLVRPKPVPLTDAEFKEMMSDFDQAGDWMKDQLRGRKR